VKWNAFHTDLRETLAGLFYTRDSSQPVIVDAGLPVSRITWHHNPTILWQSAIEAASKIRFEPAKKDGAIKGRLPSAADAAQEQADAHREPGKMSREEAKQLLDSLKSGDRKMPLAPSARGQASSRDDEPIKDW